MLEAFLRLLAAKQFLDVHGKTERFQAIADCFSYFAVRQMFLAGFIDNQLRKRTFHVTPEGAQGHLKMNNHRISRLANPTQNKDAVHKHYTDSHDEYLHGLITYLTRQVDALQTRVVRLQRS